jgi:hypothetical protein
MSEDELTSKARGLLANGWCPACGSHLIPGPRGGAAQNFYCINRDDCRAGFNLTFYGGQLVFAEPIGEVADSTYAMYRSSEAQ